MGRGVPTQSGSRGRAESGGRVCLVQWWGEGGRGLVSTFLSTSDTCPELAAIRCAHPRGAPPPAPAPGKSSWETVRPPAFPRSLPDSTGCLGPGRAGGTTLCPNTQPSAVRAAPRARGRGHAPPRLPRATGTWPWYLRRSRTMSSQRPVI